MDAPPPIRDSSRLTARWWLKWLRLLPGIGRLRSLRPGSAAHVGALVDAFAAFAMMDDHMSAVEADLILDLLRGAFPDVDHSWLARRLQKTVRNPIPLPAIAAELKAQLGDASILAVGLQLYTLVDAAGRSERNRATFEVFMRRLGHPEYGQAILKEMRGEPSDGTPPFEQLTFSTDLDADVILPPTSVNHAFRVYRAADLVLIRNTGREPLMIRGRSMVSGAFLRMRERQQLVVPGWTITYDDLVFFLDVRRTGTAPSLYLAVTEEGLTAERNRSRQSSLRIRFGLSAEIECLRLSDLTVGPHGFLPVGKIVHCANHERLSATEHGSAVTIDSLRRKATQTGRRFRLTSGRREFLISNDPAALSGGDLLLAPGLSPKVVLHIRLDGDNATGVLDVREADGPVTVDGFPTRGLVQLVDGTVIRLSGNQSLRCRFGEGIIDEERSLIESLAVTDLIHDFLPGSRALDNVNFSVRRGEMMCIIGPSGSGKSTLLAILSGQLHPSRGLVRMNGISLYDQRERLVPFIAYMPQEEALNPQLTVIEHLRHAITIRRPTLSPAEHERRVDGIIAELSLQGISRRRVGSPGEKTLSGGERSRLNLGLDLGSRAEVFLFDEPISGLSSKDSEHVAETLRSLAREKIVIASLHRPGAPVLRLFDRVLLLDNGGRIAFFGTPDAMVAYFRDACEELSIAHPGVMARSPLGADFVFDILETPFHLLGGAQNPGATRRFPPTFWQERFESTVLMRSLVPDSTPPVNRTDEEDGGAERMPLPTRPVRRLRAALALFSTHLQRSLYSKIRNRGTIYSTLLEVPLLAALIGITLRSAPEKSYDFATALHIPAYLFLSATVAMFLGLTNTATEILRDRPILRRERNCQPNPWLYVAAKFTALAIVGGAQCLIYLALGNPILEIRGMLWEHWVWMTLTTCTGTGLALVVSAVVTTERAALTSVPLLLVPQMLLAGALVPYRDMNRTLFSGKNFYREHGGIPVPAMFMPLRYSYEAMVITQATRNPFEIERYPLQRRVEMIKPITQSLSPDLSVRFNLMKDGLTRMLAAGATNPSDAKSLIHRITAASRYGTQAEMDAIKIWPDKPRVRPASDYFVNSRIDLLVREAEAFRTDYRSKIQRDVFLALEKPVFGTQMASLKLLAGVQVLIMLVCGALSAAILSAQHRRTR